MSPKAPSKLPEPIKITTRWEYKEALIGLFLLTLALAINYALPELKALKIATSITVGASLCFIGFSHKTIWKGPRERPELTSGYLMERYETDTYGYLTVILAVILAFLFYRG